MPESNPIVGGRGSDANSGPEQGFAGLTGIAGFAISYNDRKIKKII